MHDDITALMVSKTMKITLKHEHELLTMYVTSILNQYDNVERKEEKKVASDNEPHELISRQ